MWRTFPPAAISTYTAFDVRIGKVSIRQFFEEFQTGRTTLKDTFKGGEAAFDSVVNSVKKLITGACSVLILWRTFSRDGPFMW